MIDGRRQVDCSESWWASSSKRTIADSDTPRRADVEKTGGRRAQPASKSRRQTSDVLQPVCQVLRCSAVKSSVDTYRQFELDVLGRLQPVKTGESICNMLTATKTGDRLSCRVEGRL